MLGRCAFSDHRVPMFFEALRDRGALRRACAGACVHNDVDGRQHVLMPTKRFSHQTFYSIPTHSVPNESSRHGQT
jgi:hypothetical protein